MALRMQTISFMFFVIIFNFIVSVHGESKHTPILMRLPGGLRKVSVSLKSKLQPSMEIVDKFHPQGIEIHFAAILI